MAEVIAALGLACSVIQVISFASETFKLTRNVLKHGSPDPSLASKTKRLKELHATLEGDVSGFDPVYPDTDEKGATESKATDQQEARRQLKELVETLVRDIDKLEKVIEKITASTSKSRRARLKAML